MSKLSVATAFASAIVIGTAMASAAKIYDPSPYAIPAPFGGTEAAVGLSTGFEQAEGFNLGPINGQEGWSTFTSGTNPNHALAPVISGANPMSGAQHLRNPHEPGSASGAFVGAFSPDMPQGPNTFAIVSANFNVSGATFDGLNADHEFLGQSPTEGFLSFRVLFSFTGDILVLDDPGTGLAFVNTGATWNNAVDGTDGYRNFTVNFDPGADSIDYFLDGNLIYSSQAGVFAGTTVDQVIMFRDNFGVNEFGDWDNLTVIPEPATLALAGLAGLGLLRRRRA